jgi:hypothetical protein
MARKKAKRTSMKKIAPSPLTFAFTVPDGTSTIDLSQCASVLNRRFYRQGINWVVSGFRLFTPTPVVEPGRGMGIYKLPQTWSMTNAWQKSFSAWNKQQREAIDDAGASSAVAAFRDFKIHADVTHVTSGFGNNLKPTDGLNSVAVMGEWEPSLIVLPNFVGDTPAERTLHMVGTNVNGTTSRGMIEGYADSRAYPQSPDPVSPDIDSSGNWLARMFDTGNDINEILENATERNDELPYTQVDYPGGQTQLKGLQIVDAAYFSAGTNSNKLYLKGDNFPCGLIRIVSTAGINTELLIDLVPGSHKGYMCQPMSEM